MLPTLILGLCGFNSRYDGLVSLVCRFHTTNEFARQFNFVYVVPFK